MKWFQKEKGQSTVEFALTLPILIILVFGIIDFSWLFYNKIEVNNASREGARYAIVHHAEASYVADTQAHVASFTDGANVTVVSNGDQITVTVSKRTKVLSGLTSTFLGEYVDLTSDCTMRKE